MRCISEHLLAFMVEGIRRDSSKHCIYQPDQTPNLLELKHCAFNDTVNIFKQFLKILLALQKYLFGTCASDNQVKPLVT